MAKERNLRGQTPVGVDVAVTSTQVLPANNSRRVAIIVNASDTDMYFAVGQNAVALAGLYARANGGTLILDEADFYSTQAINGIHAGSGTKRATAQEFI